MAYITDEVLNDIRGQANIVDIVSSYLPTTRKGRNYVTVCPFHDDHSPSLVISPEKQIFNCFTCRTGGNVFTFVMKYENVNFLEAVQIVARKIGYSLKIDTSIIGESKYKSEYEAMEFAKKFYVNNINTDLGLDARKYLLNRGITENIIKEFNIGLSLTDKDTLYKLLSNKKYNVDLLEDLGLVNKMGLDIHDTFTNRIMIPIEDIKGQVVGFTGRIFHNEDAAKYMNTKETVIFKKSHILFNYHNAKDSIRQEKKVIVVEGNMDAIKVSASGIKNVVALMGVALSNEQIDTLKKLRVPVILCLDNDAAGKDATVKLGELLLSKEIDTQVVRLSGAKDPDEYIEKFGKEAFIDNINHAIKYIDFKLEFLKENKNLNNMEDIISYVKEVIGSLKNADDLTKELVISKISKDYEVDVNLIKKELSKLAPVKKIEVQEREVAKRKKVKYEVASGKILYAMMDNPKYINIFKKRVGYLKNKVERIIEAEIVYYNKEHNGINLADFASYIMDNEEVYQIVMDIINDNVDLEITDDIFDSCIEVLLEELKKDEIKELKVKIKEELDVNKKVELLEKLREVKKGSVE